MQQVVRKNNSKKKLFVGLIILALIALVSGAVAYTKNIGPFSDAPIVNESAEINYDEPTDEQKQAGNEVKEDSVTPAGEASKPTRSTSGSSQPSTSKKVSVEITNWNVNQGTLTIKTLIQDLGPNGKCTLTLSKSGQNTVTKTSAVQALPNSSTCKGFSVSNLASGSWNIKVDYKSEKSQGSASEVVTI